MSKKLLLTVLLLWCYLLLSAQEWRVRYAGKHPDGYTHFHDGLVDATGTTFLVGQEGPDRDHATALLLRIDPVGTTAVYQYETTGFHTEATCIVETADQHLFVAGRQYDDTDDRLMVLVFDKALNLLSERFYEKEVEALRFGPCKGISDPQGNIIIATYVTQHNEYLGTDYRGVLYTFHTNGDLIRHRYLIGEPSDPVSNLTDFRVRQLWSRPHDHTLLCLAPGYGGVMSFISFDSAFNYMEEHPIWRDEIDKSDHTLFQDCYTDYWYADDEALFFSSRGDADHNKLRVSRVNTHGEILDMIHLNEQIGIIDDAARPRCMAAANDSTFYFSFHSHQQGYHPGDACVYRLNKQLEITGSYVDDHGPYRTGLILPTRDGGCITVNDSCNDAPYMTTALPFINKLSLNDFDGIPWALSSPYQEWSVQKAFPNPCSETLYIPISNSTPLEKTRCRVVDSHGRIITDRIVQTNDGLLVLDTSKLKKGLYTYRVYSDRTPLSQGCFVKQ